MDWCGASLTLAWSPKNGEVFRIGRDPLPPPPPLALGKGGGAGVCKKAETKLAVLLSASVKRFGISRVRDFFRGGIFATCSYWGEEMWMWLLVFVTCDR